MWTFVPGDQGVSFGINPEEQGSRADWGHFPVSMQCLGVLRLNSKQVISQFILQIPSRAMMRGPKGFVKVCRYIWRTV